MQQIKSFLLIALLLFSLTSPSLAIENFCNKDDEKTPIEVRAVFDEMLKTVSTKNINGIMALIANEKNVVFYGTSANEKYIGYEAIKKAFEKTFADYESMKVNIPWIAISYDNDVAWINADCDITMKTKSDATSKFRLRKTLVLQRFKDKWLIVTAHSSLGALEEPYDMVKNKLPQKQEEPLPIK